MAFLRDCCVVAVLMFRANGMPRLQGCKVAAAQSHTTCILLRCAQARLALTQKSSTGGWVHG